MFMKKLLTICILGLLTTLVQSQVFKTIEVTTAGTLSSLLTAIERTSITDLTITGNIDARDVKCLRDQISKLAVLDISAANIQPYSGSDGTDTNTSNYPSNTLPTFSFYKSTGNTTLKTIKLPNTVTSIGFWAFNKCTGLNNITLGNSLSSINGAFGQCSGVTNFSVQADNNNFVAIDGVLYNKDITSIVLYPQGKSGNFIMPSSIVNMVHGAFYNCSGLTGSLTIPNDVTSISSNDFYGCSGLTSIIIPNSVTTIGSWAFTYCSSLTSIIIPNTVTSIGSSAFRDCTNLTSVYIGNSVSSIGDVAFMNCTKINHITVICNNPPTILANTFMGVAKNILLEVPLGKSGLYASTNYWSDFLNVGEITVTSIGDASEFKNLTKVYSSDCHIIIENSTIGEKITIFTLQGQPIQTIKSNGKRIILSVDKNAVYLVKTGEKIFKVII